MYIEQYSDDVSKHKEDAQAALAPIIWWRWTSPSWWSSRVATSLLSSPDLLVPNQSAPVCQWDGGLLQHVWRAGMMHSTAGHMACMHACMHAA